MIEFSHPYMFLLLFLPFLWRFVMPRVKGLHGDALKVPFISSLAQIKATAAESGSFSFGRASKSGLLKTTFAVYALLCVAAARPLWIGEPFRAQNFGRKIVLALDISTSMLEEDYAISGKRTSRINAVKVAAYDFLDKRLNDKIGLVLFGTRAYLQSPPTFDREVVKKIVLDMQPGMAGRSTSIGDALALATKSLSEQKDNAAKIIILLTDGENNDGAISLDQAVKLAKEEGTKIYTIGVGNEHSLFQSFLSAYTGLTTENKNPELEAIAKETQGQYFKASDTSSLLKIYDIIDKMEADEDDDKFVKNTKDIFYIPLIFAILLAVVVILIEGKNR